MQVFFLFFENKINSQYQKSESDEMVPVKLTHFKHFDADNHEDYKTDGLLDDFKLHQCERSAMHSRAHSVSRNHEWILEKRNTPAC